MPRSKRRRLQLRLPLPPNRRVRPGKPELTGAVLIRASAVVCSTRPHGETASIVRLLTPENGLVAAYVAGGRGRQLRPVLLPGNAVAAELRWRSEAQLPFATLELVTSRGPWLSEPLAAAATAWVTALTASALPERHAYPALYTALPALLDAICHAPSARGWLPGLLAYEALLMRELGYGAPDASGAGLDGFDALGKALSSHIFADSPLARRPGDVMAARAQLRERLARMIA